MILKEKLKDASAYIVPILLIGLWVIGAFHGKKKHNVDPFSSTFFVCWYYGLETIWHKTDYNELNDDIKVVAFLIMQKPKGFEAKEQLKYNETKKELKKVLDKLETKEIDYIKEGTNAFVGFLSSFQEDIILAFSNYKISKRFEFHFSDNTRELSEKCSTYGLDKEIADLKLEIKKIESSIKEAMESDIEIFDESLWEEKKMKDDAIQTVKDLNSTVNEIFNK